MELHKSPFRSPNRWISSNRMLGASSFWDIFTQNIGCIPVKLIINREIRMIAVYIPAATRQRRTPKWIAKESAKEALILVYYRVTFPIYYGYEQERIYIQQGYL